MEEKRTLTVEELIRSFVTVSYLQEQRIFKFIDIWNYIAKCCNYSYPECNDSEKLRELTEEAEEVIDYMRATGVLSYVYPNGDNGMYRIENKVDYMAFANLDKEYVKDMVKVFLCINGGNHMNVTLIPSKAKEKNR